MSHVKITWSKEFLMCSRALAISATKIFCLFVDREFCNYNENSYN